MNRAARFRPPLLAALAALGGTLPVSADDRVILVATASETYSTQRLDASSQPRVETYVFMEGKNLAGITQDRSADATSFRQVTEFLAPELDKQHYLPTRDAANADLLLVVHRGTTTPRVSVDQIRSVFSFDALRKEEVEILGKEAVYNQMNLEVQEQNNDQAGDVSRRDSNAQLLGYNQQLTREKSHQASSAAEVAMRTEVSTERYFLIVRAYDMKTKRAGGSLKEPIWVLYST